MSQSASRCFELLATVIRTREPMALMELAAMTSLDKSTASRLLELLVSRGFLYRDGATKRYSVGPEFLSLASMSLRQMDFREVFRRHIEELRDASNETATVHLKVGLNRVCIDGAEGRQPIRRGVSLGDSFPLYVGVSSKVILAHLSAEEFSAVMAEARNEVDSEEINRQVAFVRQRGYLAALSDRIEGVGVIAAPIFDGSGIKAALTIAGPSERWTVKRMEDFAPTLKTAARQISEALGHSSGADAKERKRQA